MQMTKKELLKKVDFHKRAIAKAHELQTKAILDGDMKQAKRQVLNIAYQQSCLIEICRKLENLI